MPSNAHQVRESCEEEEVRKDPEERAEVQLQNETSSSVAERAESK
jgi:hypothetical protein